MTAPATQHVCHCQTTRRTAAVLLNGTESKLDSFDKVVSSLASSYVADLSLLTFSITGDGKFSSPGILRNFLETHWPGAAPEFLVCWIDGSKPIASQIGELAKAQPLASWTSDSETPLRQILEERRIDTWFQPIFTADGLQLWGYECLARATDDDGAVISPASLLSWAAKENLLFMFDRICRERHIENAANVPDAGNLNFLINFLPTVIYDPSVCLSTTFAAARKAGLPARQIIFEVVESEKIENREFLRKILDEYRSAGFRVALDDLGSGHAGLNMLGDLAPDLIKIDRELVTKSISSKMHRIICQSVISLARDANKLVLAEGVETRAEYELFQSLGVDLYQGYLFGRPAAAPARTAQVTPLNESR